MIRRAVPIEARGLAQPSTGSGLGLSIAEAVAQRHGGALTIDPVGAGFAVSLRLPRARKGDRPTSRAGQGGPALTGE